MQMRNDRFAERHEHQSAGLHKSFFVNILDISLVKFIFCRVEADRLLSNSLGINILRDCDSKARKGVVSTPLATGKWLIFQYFTCNPCEIKILRGANRLVTA